MKKSFLIILFASVIASCGRFSNEDTKEENQVRMVCISKQCTEMIYALGAEQNIVAVDISSVYPPQVKKLPTVGYHRALSIEGILAAKPSIIVHSGIKTLGPEHVVTQLEQLKIPMKEFSQKTEDLDGAKNLMREMGAYFHKEQRADSLCMKLDADIEKALESAKQYTDTPSVLVIHFGQASNIYLVMTKKSTAAKMVTWAGGKMAVEDEKGMKQLSAEVVAKSNPDIILLTDFGYDRLGTAQKIMELPGVAITNAAKNNRIYRVEENDMVYIGPRTGENVLKLQTILHAKK